MINIKKRAKYYGIYELSRFIKHSEKWIEIYKRISESKNTMQEYTDIIQAEFMPICKYAWKLSKSCKSCSIYVVSGKLCTEDITYSQLDDLFSRHTPKSSAIRVLENRILFHENII